MPLIYLNSQSATFFRDILDRSYCMSIRVGRIKDANQFPSIGGRYSSNAASIKDGEPNGISSRTSFDMNIRSAKQVVHSDRNPGRTLSLRAPSK